MIADNNKATVWKSKGLSDEELKPPSRSNNTDNAKLQIKLDGGLLKQDKVTFTSKGPLNFYILYEINLQLLNLDSKFASLDFYFGSVTLHKNVDSDKHFYFGNDFGFYVFGIFHCQMVAG